MAICLAYLRRWGRGKSRNATCSSRLHQLRSRLPGNSAGQRRRLKLSREAVVQLSFSLTPACGTKRFRGVRVAHSGLRSPDPPERNFQLKARTVAAKVIKTASEAVIIQSGLTARSLAIVAVASLAAGDLSCASITMGRAYSARSRRQRNDSSRRGRECVHSQPPVIAVLWHELIAS